MRHRTNILAFAAAAVLPLVAAQAKEVRYPAANPQVALNAPGDWTVEETSLGLELQSPQKDSLVLVALTSGDRKAVDGWAKRALERMGRAGVVFAKDGPAKPAAPKPAAPKPAAPKPAAPKPAVPPSIGGLSSGGAFAGGQPAGASTADVAQANGDHAYTFAGPPTVQPPNLSSGDAPPVAGRAGDLNLQTLTDDPNAMKPTGHFLYTGGILQGQQVDVELSVFPFGKNRRLLTEQQSGATDARGVMIVRSLRDLTQR